MTPRKRSPWFRFTTASLLLLIFFAAGAFVGFRYGLSEGVETQVRHRLADQKAMVFTKVYRVTELLTDAGGKRVEPLALDQIASEVEKSFGDARRWKDTGPCKIATTAPDMLVISASSTDHDQVVAYLHGRRKGIEDLETR